MLTVTQSPSVLLLPNQAVAPQLPSKRDIRLGRFVPVISSKLLRRFRPFPGWNQREAFKSCRWVEGTRRSPFTSWGGLRYLSGITPPITE